LRLGRLSTELSEGRLPLGTPLGVPFEAPFTTAVPGDGRLFPFPLLRTRSAGLAIITWLLMEIQVMMKDHA